MSEINISQYKCRGYLFSSYNLLEMSAIEIGKENKVSYNTIYNWLKKFNIQIRTPKEHQIITQNKPEIKAKKSKSNKGKNNPNYGKFGDKHHNWKGNNIGFGQIHLRAHRIDPKPEDEKCEICGKVADKKGITKLIHSNKDHSINYQ